MFNPVVPYEYLLPTVYLFMANITHPALFVCGCRTWICLDITCFYEEQPSSGSTWPACPKTVNLVPIAGAWRFLIQFVQQFVTTVTATLLIGGIIWNLFPRLSLLPFIEQGLGTMSVPIPHPALGWFTASCSCYLTLVAWNNLPASVMVSGKESTLMNHCTDHPMRHDFLATRPDAFSE